jgi:Mycobacterium membrane protein
VVRAIRALVRGWIPLVLVVALALSGFTTYRMHGIFGSHHSAGAGGGGADQIVPFNPKRVLYEVYGATGTVGSISYLDENAQPHRADFTTLPWSYLVTTTLPSMFANLVAQGDSDAIECRISVNAEVREHQSATGFQAGDQVPRVAACRYRRSALACTDSRRATAIAVIGLLALPGYKTSYNDRNYIPASLSSNVGYAAAERHFSAARMNPDILLLDAGSDLRNAADMIVLDKIAKSLFRVPGIARVQNITRPLGDPIAHSSIPFQVSMQSVSMTENMQFLRKTMADMLRMTDQLGIMISTLQQMQALTARMADTTHQMLGNMKEMKATTDEMRNHLADFDDFFRPLRNYFYWSRTVTTSRSAIRCGRCSTASTASTDSATTSTRSWPM